MKYYQIIYLSIIFISSSLYATEQKVLCYEQGYIIDENQIAGSYNAPERLCLPCRHHFFTEGSFIYWQPREEGLNLAISSTDSGKRTFVKIPFSYSPGFKAAIGLISKDDSWSSKLQYTWIKEENSKSKNAKSNKEMIPLWSIPLSTSVYLTSSYLTSTWNLDFNMLDLSVSRTYYVGLNLTMTPSFALQGGWINQALFIKSNEYDSNLLQRYISAIRAVSNSWILGPKAEFSSNYLFTKKIQLSGKASASLLYQKFNLSFREERKNLENLSASDNTASITPFLEMLLGFKYGTYFFNYKEHLTLFCGYDLNIFWNQNLMRSFKDSLVSYSNGEAEDMILHGITLDMNLEF